MLLELPPAPPPSPLVSEFAFSAHNSRPTGDILDGLIGPLVAMDRRQVAIAYLCDLFNAQLTINQVNDLALGRFPDDSGTEEDAEQLSVSGVSRVSHPSRGTATRMVNAVADDVAVDAASASSAAVDTASIPAASMSSPDTLHPSLKGYDVMPMFDDPLIQRFRERICDHTRFRILCDELRANGQLDISSILIDDDFAALGTLYDSEVEAEDDGEVKSAGRDWPIDLAIEAVQLFERARDMAFCVAAAATIDAANLPNLIPKWQRTNDVLLRAHDRREQTSLYIQRDSFSGHIWSLKRMAKTPLASRIVAAINAYQYMASIWLTIVETHYSTYITGLKPSTTAALPLVD